MSGWDFADSRIFGRTEEMKWNTRELETGAAREIPRVLLQQNFAAHYRRAVLQELGRSSAIEFVLVADSSSGDADIETVDPASATFNWTLARHYVLRIGRRLRIHFQPECLRLVAKSNFDVVIAEGSVYSLTAWLLTVLNSRKTFRLIFWTHGLTRAERGWKWILRKALYSQADSLMVYAERGRQLLLSQGFTKVPIYVVHNSLDYPAQKETQSSLAQDDVQAFRSKLNIPASATVLVFVGRLAAIKKLDLVIEAIGELRREQFNVHLLLLGDGPERSSLEALAERTGTNHAVHFLGAVYEEKIIGTALVGAAASVIPAGAGLSVLHAMGYGVPVILHDDPNEHGPEAEAVEEGVTGMHFKKGNVSDLVRAIRQIATNEQLRRELSANCLNRVSRMYSPEAHAAAIISCIESTKMQ